jgi:hypothetical protein
MQAKAPLTSSWVGGHTKKRGLGWVLQLRKSLKIVPYLLCVKDWLHFHSILRGNLITMKVPLPRGGTFQI